MTRNDPFSCTQFVKQREQKGENKKRTNQRKFEVVSPLSLLPTCGQTINNKSSHIIVTVFKYCVED